MTWNDNWATAALCRGGGQDAMFVRGAQQQDAKRLCGGCPVRTECLADALDGAVEWGVWGGMTERERRALLLRHPQMPSWRKFFERARAAHDRAAGRSPVAQPQRMAAAA